MSGKRRVLRPRHWALSLWLGHITVPSGPRLKNRETVRPVIRARRRGTLIRPKSGSGDLAEVRSRSFGMTASQDPCGGGRRSPVTAMGHDEPFPPPRPNGRCRVRKRSVGAEIEEGRQALRVRRGHTASVCLPHGGMRKRYGLYSEYVIHLPRLRRPRESLRGPLWPVPRRDAGGAQACLSMLSGALLACVVFSRQQPQ